MATKHFPRGLDGRMRDQNGEIRQKRSDTKVDTLRKTYGDDFAKGTALTVQELSRWSARTTQFGMCLPQYELRAVKNT